MAQIRKDTTYMFSQEYKEAIADLFLCWISLEWRLIACAECFDKDFARKIEDGKWPSGIVASNFLDLARLDTICPDQRLLKAGNLFKDMVKRRNHVFHAYPCAGARPDVGAISTPDRKVLSQADIESFADEVAVLHYEFDELLSEYLQPATLGGMWIPKVIRSQ